ncbi:RICIN domain-containing protein [Streptomyces sp. NPDC051243]|uniref:RICIN domain-containing protein n=1 Tax=Streptomyces sp. NPDC051243 TaxID=3365646 RepID=UPI0037AF0A39
MGSERFLRPEDASDAAEFVALMRRAKERSGLTYRELEQRAAARGDVLAKSTLANVLARDGLPRAELVAAFVRACEGDDRVPQWLEARERVAASAAEVPAVPGAAGPPAREQGTRAWNFRWITTATVACLALATVALLARYSSDDPDTTDPAKAGDASASPTASPFGDGPLRIRPVQSPTLCLTDGFLRDGRYESQVAVHRPCAKAEPPVTDLVAAGNGTYRVRWTHPVHASGCLKVLTGEATRGLLEPQNNCAAATVFRIEPAPTRTDDGTSTSTSQSASTSTSKAKTYVLRVDESRCVGVAAAQPEAGTEATVQTCDGAKAQQYLIGPTGD